MIRQIWITSRSGVISKRPPSADEGFRFIKALLLLSHSPVQLLFLTTFRLAVVSTPILAWQPSAPGRAVSATILAMQQVARETRVAFERRLERAQVPAPQHPDYHKWTRFYLDFCSKYGHAPRSPTSVGSFLSLPCLGTAGTKPTGCGPPRCHAVTSPEPRRR